jgi:hypothetical protein
VGDRLPVLDSVAFVRAMRGGPTAELFHEMDRVSRTVSDRRVTTSFARPMDAFFDDRYAEASDLLRPTLQHDDVAFGEAWIARCALWTGDPATAREQLARLDGAGYLPPVGEVRRLQVRAGIAAVEGDVDTALSSYREVLRSLSDLGLVFEGAIVRLDMAALLDPTLPAVQAAVEQARAILGAMKATRVLGALDRAIARHGSGQRAPSAATSMTAEPA